MKRILATLLAALMLISMLPVVSLAADGTYESATSIAVGDTVVLVCESKGMEMSTIGTQKYGEGKAYTGAPTGLVPLTVEAGTAANSFAFKTPAGTYLYWTAGNYLQTTNSITDNSSWTVAIADGVATIANV